MQLVVLHFLESSNHNNQDCLSFEMIQLTIFVVGVKNQVKYPDVLCEGSIWHAQSYSVAAGRRKLTTTWEMAVPIMRISPILIYLVNFDGTLEILQAYCCPGERLFTSERVHRNSVISKYPGVVN